MYVMIGTGAEIFAIAGTFFVVTSFVSSGVQKKENSDDCLRCRDDGDEVTFDGEAISFDSSASEFQKKESSETSFIHGVTGDEMSFVGEMI